MDIKRPKEPTKVTLKAMLFTRWKKAQHPHTPQSSLTKCTDQRDHHDKHIHMMVLSTKSSFHTFQLLSNNSNKTN